MQKKKNLVKVQFIIYINELFIDYMISITLRKLIFSILINLFLFLFLMMAIQNSQKKSKVNFIFTQSIKLPVSFIIGTSFISGSLIGGLIKKN